MAEGFYRASRSIGEAALRWFATGGSRLGWGSERRGLAEPSFSRTQWRLALCLGATSVALPVGGPLLGFSALLSAFGAAWLVVAAVVRLSFARSLAATTMGLLPALPVVAFVHDAFDGASTSVLRFTLLATWSVMGGVLGGAVARQSKRADAITTVGASVPALLFVWPLLPLLRPMASSAQRLQLFLGEIDNSVFVAVAQEVLTVGPRTGGSGIGRPGFAVLADAALTIWGTLSPSIADARLSAVYLVVVAAVMAIALIAAGLVVSLIVDPLNRRSETCFGGEVTRSGRTLSFVITPVVAAVTVTTGLLFAAIAPLRTGFLTFAWGLVWVSLAYVALSMARASSTKTARLAAVVSAASAAWMTAATHPTAVPAALLVLGMTVALSLGQEGGYGLQTSSRLPRRVRAFMATGATALASFVGLPVLAGRASLPQLSVDSLSAGGSGIAVETPVRVALGLAMFAWIIKAVLSARSPEQRSNPFFLRLVALSAPLLPVFGFAGVYFVILWTSQEIPGAQGGYFARKALYAVAASIVLFVLPSLASRRHPSPVLPSLGAVAATLSIALGSALPGYALSWDFWATFPESPHSISVIRAIEVTTPEVAIRCRPDPNLVVDWQIRQAAYFCVAWPETAFNGRSAQNAFRSEYLDLEDGELLAGVVEEAEAAGLFFTARTFPMERGWFGWPGPS